MRVEWNCAITGSGAQSVMICGVHLMLVLLANSLVTLELVGITFITSDIMTTAVHLLSALLQLYT